jgi:hypothetical protein
LPQHIQAKNQTQMKKIYSLLFIAVIYNAAIAQTQPTKTTPAQKPATKASPVLSVPQKESTEKSKDAGSMEGNMKAWMAYMTPGPMHKMLAGFDGTWQEEVTIWMKPDAQPTKSFSKCTNQMILGDRYQESTHTGDMGGMPFEGRGYTGYDNAKKVFVSTWLDNMGTGIMNMEGTWDKSKKTIHFTGNAVDPMSGKEMKVREEFKVVDDNNQLMEMYLTQNGKEFKSLEIKFTR